MQQYRHYWIFYWELHLIKPVIQLCCTISAEQLISPKCKSTTPRCIFYIYSMLTFLWRPISNSVMWWFLIEYQLNSTWIFKLISSRYHVLVLKFNQFLGWLWWWRKWQQSEIFSLSLHFIHIKCFFFQYNKPKAFTVNTLQRVTHKSLKN